MILNSVWPDTESVIMFSAKRCWLIYCHFECSWNILKSLTSTDGVEWVDQDGSWCVRKGREENESNYLKTVGVNVGLVKIMPNMIGLVFFDLGSNNVF